MIDKSRCPKCFNRLMPVMRKGRTELRCIKCDKIDPMKTDAVKWASSPLSPPERVA